MHAMKKKKLTNELATKCVIPYIYIFPYEIYVQCPHHR